MIRTTIDLVPGGDETRIRTIGLVEIANVGGDLIRGDYLVVLKKTPPFKGALRSAWRQGRLPAAPDDEEILSGEVLGHHRQQRGSYDLLYRALRSCGLDERNPR